MNNLIQASCCFCWGTSQGAVALHHMWVRLITTNKAWPQNPYFPTGSVCNTQRWQLLTERALQNIPAFKEFGEENLYFFQEEKGILTMDKLKLFYSPRHEKKELSPYCLIPTKMEHFRFYFWFIWISVFWSINAHQRLFMPITRHLLKLVLAGQLFTAVDLKDAYIKVVPSE